MECHIPETDLAHAGQSVSFGPFRLLPAQQLLLENGEPVLIGARALNLLVALTARPGEVLGNEELMAFVWPGTFVEDSNIRVHIAGLRRTLRDGRGGNRYIVNVPGRGYSFVAPLQVEREQPPRTQKLPGPQRQGNLPGFATRIIGRAAIVETLRSTLAQRRFITLVGAAGIGKTKVAVAAAGVLCASYRDGVWFVDFSRVTSPQLVPSVIATLLGLAVPSGDAMPAVVAHLQDKNMLLVLDNCEHVIETAAAAAEQISTGAPDVHILATSREPLRAAGERVHRLPPLEGPSTTTDLTAEEAMTFPGIELFVERVAASLNGFVLTDADAPVVADICQRLDGIALALELAAGRVAAFGLRELAARLDDRFRLLTSGRRTALARHQTLSAALDWSFELLPVADQTLLRRLAVFAGEFSLNAAAAVMDAPEADNVPLQIADLVSKSLVVADSSTGIMRYRLLESTRIYGLDKMRKSDELQRIRGVHAQYFRDLFAPAEADCETLASSTWLATYASQVDNVRAALDWAGSADGDPDVLVALTVSAIPLWVDLSLMSECRARVERALAALGDSTSDTDNARMRLGAALGWTLMYAAGRTREIGAAWGSTLDLAARLNNEVYYVRALWGVWMSKLNTGDLAAALDHAQRLHDRIEGSQDTADLMLADRLMATTLHYRGDQGKARVYIDRMLIRHATHRSQPRIARFHVDQQVTAHYFQARIMWLQGYPDQARKTVERNLEEGRVLDHALSFASVLGQGACPVALFTGDLPAARRHGLALLNHSERHGLRLWQVWASCFSGLVTLKQGDVEAGLQTMSAAFHEAGDARFLPRYMVLLGEFAAALGQVGDVTRALSTMDGILARCETSQERWYVPELLRMKGELFLQQNAANATIAAEEHFTQAIQLATLQDARSWQLRSSVSLARLWRDLGRMAEARNQLSQVYTWFSEGFTTADLQGAHALLADL
jgi:predicted ATPase/DNA-binding winged helix-turn-helix (wHTH) protein